MPNIVLEIAENGRQLHLRRGSVAVMAGEECLGLVPLDSLACVLLAADGIMISRAFMARMAEEGVPVVVCGANYMPVSISLPTAPHYRALPVVTAQMNASPVLKKRLWQQCVIAKLRNQAAVLRLCRPESPVPDRILALSGKVRSGDADNREAGAARLYWPALLGADFLRDPEGDGPNAALNYGYAILRSVCARALCGVGLLPLLGIHHRNTYNAFCLADDMMEPLRPFMDHLVFQLHADGAELVLTPHNKRLLAAILGMAFPLSGEQLSLSALVARMAQGLARSFQDGSPQWPLPDFPMP